MWESERERRSTSGIPWPKLRNWLNAYLIQTCRRKKTTLLALGRPHISCRKKHKCSLITSIKRTLYKIKFYKLNKALKYFIKQFACMYHVTFLWDRGVILLRLEITKIYSLVERNKSKIQRIQNNQTWIRRWNQNN